MIRLLFLVLIIQLKLYSQTSIATPIDYDIVYVRYPAKEANGGYVKIPQGEDPYTISAGADLMLLKPDGSQIILVDCTKCSVMDPFISYDGKTVFYSLIENNKNSSPSWLYKINLDDITLSPTQLTFPEPFPNHLYAGNKNKAVDLTKYRGIRDMAPVPLSDGRVLFTSNRASLVALNAGTDEIVNGSVQQLYVMDNHSGSANTSALANIKRLETGSIHMVQHPIQLLDGRILFSSWHDVAHKFTYAMTNLMTVNPDGSNLRQFTEPHSHKKELDHFITQSADSSVISGLYYPSFDYGFGVLLRSPLTQLPIEYLRGNISQHYLWNKGKEKRVPVSKREFDRINSVVITPHTTSGDEPAPNLSGKYSMPSATKNDGLLVAYSTGSVNHFKAKCSQKKLCEHLKSGIYLISNASTNIVNSPSQLTKIIDDVNYNEIWPRAVLPYKAIYAVSAPSQLPSTLADNHGEATAVVGSASMLNYEALNESNPDPFQSDKKRERHDGNWTIQGAQAGLFTDNDVYAVRIISTPSKPFTAPINKYQNKQRWQNIQPYLQDKRLSKVVARYGSFHGEKWEILGEFPLPHKTKGLRDSHGHPDTSWQAKIPAETPFLIQALDQNGMTLISELTWRALKPGEKRVDCGGCHAHSIPAVNFDSTASGKGYFIYDIPGVDDLDPRINDGIWDLTTGSTPVLSNQGVTFHESGILDVEFRRDIYPILQGKCLTCHNSSKNKLDLSGSSDEVYQQLSKSDDANGKKYVLPQISRYIRSPQARQSLLVWVAYNQRLDGRRNHSRIDDVDYPIDHPVTYLTDSEKRKLARWIDLGGPIDFGQTDGFGYTDDSQLPVIHISAPIRTEKEALKIQFGLHDSNSGLDHKSLVVSLYEVRTKKLSAEKILEKSQKVNLPESALKPKRSYMGQDVFYLNIPSQYLSSQKHYIVEVAIDDMAGNTNRETLRFSNSP